MLQKRTIKNPWTLENFEINMEVIGKGSFGHVLKTYKKNDTKKLTPIAIKFSQTIDVEIFNQNVKEVVNMARLGHHPNIVRCFDFNTFSSFDENSGSITYYVQVAMECADKSVEQLLKENAIKKKNISLPDFLNIATDSLLAFKHMEKMKIAHLDFKPANILYFVEKEIFKIADWAGAIESRNNKTVSKLSNRELFITHYYSAPEILALNSRSLEMNFGAADIYSLGITLLECLGIRPAQEGGGENMDWKFNKKTHDLYLKNKFFEPLKKIGLKEEIYLLIVNMLAFEPENRCNADKALLILTKYNPGRKQNLYEQDPVKRLESEKYFLENKIAELERSSERKDIKIDLLNETITQLQLKASYKASRKRKCSI